MKLVDRGRRLVAAIDALSLRERLAVFAASVFVVGGLWEATIGSPLAEREATARANVEQIRERIDLLNDSVALAAQGIGEGMYEKISRVEQLRRSVAAGEERLHVFTSDLVDAAQMRFVVEDLLKRHGGLELRSARNLEAIPIVDPAPDAPADADGPVVYRHGVVLRFEGSYLESLAYLEEIERLPWRLFWSGLTLETIEYPRIGIEVEIQTLSLDEDWIGV